MDADRFQLLSRLFEAAIALDPSLRRSFVEAQAEGDEALRTELLRLLAAHDAEESGAALLDRITPTVGVEIPAAASSADVPLEHPRQVGRYRITRPIASGGMGTVYAAEQDEPSRTVAIKILHPGLSDASVVRRFAQEAELLGRLRHPGIAHVYEIGVFGTDGAQRPFIAMELVDGVPLTDYARRELLGIPARLELMAQIADAVDAAHRAGIVHRDLKPANILVDADGRPRVLDFGVARAIGDGTMLASMRTETGQLVGTLPYMSPEQAAGRVDAIDARTDVYALGVVAYELLVGRLPYDLAGRFPHDVLRIIREDEPTRLSAIDRALRGDVETVIGHALEKEPGRRYRSAAALAADLRRAARREAIEARPASRLYRMRKFTRRHRALAVGALVTFAALSIGIVATGLALWRALDAEALAGERLVAVTRESEKAQAVNRFLQEMLAAADPRNAGGADVRVRDVLDAAATRLDSGAEPLVAAVDAAVRHTIAATYRALGLHEQARRFGEDALRTRRTLLGDAHVDTIDTISELADIVRELGDLDAAERLAEEAMRLIRMTNGGSDERLATAMNNLALVRHRQGRGDEARRLHEEALAMRRTLHGRDHMDIVTSLNNLALTVFAHERDAVRAEALLREAVAALDRMFPGGHVNLASSLDSLASLASGRGDLVDAERLSRDSLAMRRALLPEGHELIGEGLSNLGLILRRQDRLEEAEALYRESLAIRRAAWPGDHPGTATILNNLGQLLRLRGETDEAETMLREALAMRQRLFPGDHALAALSLNNLGVLLIDTDRPDEAAPLIAESVAVLSRLTGDRRADIAAYAVNLALAQRRRGDAAAAIDAAERALSLRIELHGPSHPQVAAAMIAVAHAAQLAGDRARASSLAAEALEMLDPTNAVHAPLRREAEEMLIAR